MAEQKRSRRYRTYGSVAYQPETEQESVKSAIFQGFGNTILLFLSSMGRYFLDCISILHVHHTSTLVPCQETGACFPFFRKL